MATETEKIYQVNIIWKIRILWVLKTSCEQSCSYMSDFIATTVFSYNTVQVFITKLLIKSDTNHKLDSNQDCHYTAIFFLVP